MTARVLLFLRTLTALLFVTFPTLVHAATLNVPSTSYPTIQAGVNASHDGDMVLVADGTYSGPGNRDIDFNGKNITVTSQNGPTKTIIDCQGTDANPHRGFYIHSGETNATISGFTVKNGYVDNVSTIADSGYGGGVFLSNSGSGTITLTNCTITGNTATNGGGGVFLSNSGSGTITLTNCTITGNTATGGNGGGGVYNSNGSTGSITLTNCTITGNTATYYDGGGVFNYNSYGSTGSITLTNCTITGNTATYGDGGGVFNYNYTGSTGSITLTNCTITGNTATYYEGGVFNFNYIGSTGSITLTNCTITGNTATNGGGGGVFNYNYNTGSITLNNCTITGNTATNDGGGVFNVNYNYTGSITLTNCTIMGNTATNGGGVYNLKYSGNITVINCISYGDTGGEIVNDAQSASNAIVTYCDIQGGYAGTGNITADPQFLNAAYGDVHLKPGSPCIGKGTPTGAPTTDKDGNLRPNPPTIGAYEGVGSGGSATVPQRPVGSLTLYETRYDASHVDLSDKSLITPYDSSGKPLPPLDIPKMASDTQICTGAVADGATKVLLRYNASTAGTVTFTRLFGVGDDNLRQITSLNAPTGVATQVINGQNVAFALYTVPESLDSTPEAQAAPNHFTQHPVSFQAVFTPTGGAPISAVSTTLTLESPPVLLIHGFAANPHAWHTEKGPLKELIAAGYPSYAIGIVDYSDEANNSLAYNQLVPLINTGGIRQTIYPAYRAHRIAVTKVDVVAHSKGGLVTREFAAWDSYKSKTNFYKGYVRRIITIGTPHFGTPLATDVETIANDGIIGSVFKNDIQNTPFHYGNCYPDMEPGSTALSKLGTTLVPCYAEVGNYDVQQLSDFQTFTTCYFFLATGFILATAFHSLN